MNHNDMHISQYLCCIDAQLEAAGRVLELCRHHYAPLQQQVSTDPLQTRVISAFNQLTNCRRRAETRAPVLRVRSGVTWVFTCRMPCTG
jgi:hypothetical protein